MRRRAPLFALVLASLGGCPREPSTPPDPTTREPEATEEAEPEPELCGTAALRFVDYAWIPADSRLTTAILRHDPELDASLKALADMAGTAGVQLPIHAALDYRNLALQLGNLERVLATIGLDPDELIELQSPDGDVVWLWPTDCPTATLATRALDRFGVLVRADFERPGLRRGQGSVERFPFDLLLIHDRTVALAPLGRGAAVSAWLTSPRRDDEGPGAALLSIDAAPIRSVLSGPALLGDPQADPIPGGFDPGGRHRKIRASASGWHDDQPEERPKP